MKLEKVDGKFGCRKCGGSEVEIWSLELSPCRVGFLCCGKCDWSAVSVDSAERILLYGFADGIDKPWKR